ncbi:MAG: nuclear transport factor 2 family protein [Bacteroidetes bacterium]|nr:nuclear transport factor 2 family protein [Bacteroidota bacterium]
MQKALSILIFFLLLTPSTHAQEGNPSFQLVEKMTKAFSMQDEEAMAAALSDDIGWYSILGDTLTVQAQGKEALFKGLRSYFESIPSAHSEIEESFVSGKYVIIRERGYWHQNGVQRSQSSLAVYELKDGLIARVWYFPAEEE